MKRDIKQKDKNGHAMEKVGKTKQNKGSRGVLQGFGQIGRAPVSKLKERFHDPPCLQDYFQPLVQYVNKISKAPDLVLKLTEDLKILDMQVNRQEERTGTVCRNNY